MLSFSMQPAKTNRTRFGRLGRMLMLLGSSILIMSVTLAGSATQATAGDTEIRVPISTVRNAQGTVFVALYRGDNWLKPGRYVTAQRVKAHRGTVYATFRGIPRGQYGIAVFHDENSNNRVDTNFVGLPSEGFGFSRTTPMRKPRFGEVSFTANPNAHAPIHLRY